MPAPARLAGAGLPEMRPVFAFSISPAASGVPADWKLSAPPSRSLAVGEKSNASPTTPCRSAIGAIVGAWRLAEQTLTQLPFWQLPKRQRVPSGTGVYAHWFAWTSHDSAVHSFLSS